MELHFFYENTTLYLFGDWAIVSTGPFTENEQQMSLLHLLWRCLVLPIVAQLYYRYYHIVFFRFVLFCFCCEIYQPTTPLKFILVLPWLWNLRIAVYYSCSVRILLPVVHVVPSSASSSNNRSGKVSRLMVRMGK